MAATDDKINVQIEAELTGTFQSQLNKVSELSKQVPLTKKEQSNYDAAMRGAQLSLNSGDIKGFQQNFNKIVDILRTASLSTGKLNTQIDEYTKKIEALSKEVNRRKEKLTDIDTKYYGADAKKAGQLKDQEISKIKDSYGDVAKNITIKQIRELITEGFKGIKLQDINLQKKLPDNLGMSSREEAKAYVKIARDVQAQDKSYQKERTQLINENSTDTQAIQSLEEEIRKIQEAAPAAASELEKVYLELSKLKNTTNQTITDAKNEAKVKSAKKDDVEVPTDEGMAKQVDKQNTSIGKLVKNITIYHLALRAVRTTLRSTMHTIKELDKQLTEQAMVTGKTRKETYGLLKGYQELALTLGATTKEVSQVATEYMRQGKTTEQAMKLTEAAISAAKVASINTSESVDYLTTALNGFRLSAEDAMKVSDKFAAIAANAAVSYEEIATALSKVAAQANLAGMSIDYTTAILAKGIETTREAPETIGTALKTVIARMREIKDYGETLGGDTDLNNVESQLAYVGIELKNNNGELRSTEDVLDDLGKKWDTLNGNQQAAIAKALAGTRQQSRLIAMMSDYERVIELQEIAERSQGATMAQMATYTEGMEAAMNKVAVSWEKIVTTVTDSDVIIGIVNAFANILNMVNDILSNDILLVGVLTTIGVLALNHYGQKVKERAIQREILKAQKNSRKEELKSLINERAITREKLQQEKSTILNGKKYSQLTAAEKKRVTEIDNMVKMSEALDKQSKAELETLEAQSSVTDSIGFGMSNIAAAAGSILSPIFTIASVLATILGLQAANNAATVAEGKNIDANTRKQQKQNILKRIGAAFGMASSASEMGPAGWVIAAAILATLIGVTIAVSTGFGNTKSAAEKTADQIDKLSNNIYKLQQTKTVLDTAISKFDAIDEKIIKTTEDVQAMRDALDQAADSLSSEAGESVLSWLNGKGKKHKGAQSEQDYYKSLQSDQARREFLEEEAQALERKLKEDRDKQLKLIAEASEKTRQAFFTEAKYANVRDAIYALDNAILNENIELEEKAGKVTTEQAAAIRKFTQALLENVSAEEQWNYTQHPERIERLTQALKELKTETAAGTKSSVDILGNTAYSLTDQVQAYKDIADAIKGDQSAYNAFMKEYDAFDVYLHLSESALEFVEKANLSVDKLNDIYTAYHKLQAAGVEITKEDFQGRFTVFLENLAAFNNDATSAINATFGDIISASENQAETFQAIVNTFSSIIETGLLNMGQNISTFKNSVNSFYEKAKEWTSMSDSDKAEFMTDYIDYFSGESGEALAKALESGNYAALEQSLKDNKTFQEQRVRLLQQVEEELKWELAKEGDLYNAAYVAELQRQKEFLSNMDKVFKADLSWRLEQEQNALEEYKNLLQKQADIETKQLEDRKKAYEDYFAEINEAKEDEEYEEEANMLITNLSKLGGSTNADAVKQSKELQDSLENLEKERIEALRQRAQEEIISNIDEEIEGISTKLEDIINNQQALLVAMNNAAQNPTQLLTDLINTKMMDEGLTQLGFENYWQELHEIFGSILEDVDWSSVSADKENTTSTSLVLNVSGQDYELSDVEEKQLYDTIMQALQQIGKR